MKELIFLGTNSVLERHIDACNRQNQPIAGIIDSDWFGNRETFSGLPILDSQNIFDNDPNRYKDYVFFIAVNWNPKAGRDIQKRKMFIDIVRRHNLFCINLIDPLSYVSPYAKLGKGIFIGPGVNIEPYTVVEDFATLWGNNTVGHHNLIGENSVIQRHALIHAQIKSNVYAGIGASIIRDHNMIVGHNAIIGPCLHVARDVADNENIVLDKDSHRIYKNCGPGN